jgi:hypothetical protein
MEGLQGMMFLNTWKTGKEEAPGRACGSPVGSAAEHEGKQKEKEDYAGKTSEGR